MDQVFNSVYCVVTEGQKKGTGTKNCKLNLNEIKVPILIERGTNFGTIDNSDTIDLAYFQNLQVLGKAIVFPKGYGFTQNINEDSTEENPDTGALKSTRVNPYDFTLSFENGAAWNKAINDYRSYDAYDLVWFDKNNTFVCTASKSGTLKGFTLGMFNPMPYTFGQGTNNSKEMIRIQLPFAEEFNKRVSWLTSDDLDFDAVTELDGVNDIVIEATAPNDTDTAVLFSVKDVSNGVPNIVLATADIRVLVNGVADAGVLTSLGDGNYSKAVAALTTGDEISIEIYDSTALSPAKLIGMCVYQSNREETVVL